MKPILELSDDVFYLKYPDPHAVEVIRGHFGLTGLTAKILSNRGLNSIHEVEAFLTPRLRDIPDPFGFREMEKIVERISHAIERSESILIYGDYDVDGITSTTLLLKFFSSFGFHVRYYIPNRFEDGYGLNRERLLTLYHQAPYHLLVTVDCGISGDEAIKALAKLGVDTIVTDHHKAAERPRHAYGVLDPNLESCSFKHGELAGVGVVFFLLVALRNILRKKGFWSSRNLTEPDLRQFLDIVCVGTIADLAPLRGVNRILVKHGLGVLAETPHPGLRVFLEIIQLNDRKIITPWEVAFQIAPRFNAAGRLEHGEIGVSLLMSRDKQEALSLSRKLENLNKRRQSIENLVLEETRERISKGIQGYISPFAIVLWDETWHEGVIGIVASKIVERHGRPVALISLKGEFGKGSLRGIPGVDVYEALRQASSWLVSFGGHPMAGGLKIHKEKLEGFSISFSKGIESQLGGRPPKKTWILDAIIGPDGIPDEFFSELPLLGPFGIGNPSPLLGFSEFKILSKRLIREKHIRFTFKTGSGGVRHAIAFNAADSWKNLEEFKGMVGTPGINRWNGNTIPQITVRKFLESPLRR